MDYNELIDSICFRFRHAVTEYDIFRWLRNFKDEDWDIALSLLSKVCYYSSDDIDERIEHYLQKIIADAGRRPVVIVPSGSVGKSGNVMAYHVKKVLEKLRLPDNELKQTNINGLSNIPKRAILILLDDFSGSGESIQKFYTKHCKEIAEQKRCTVGALTVAYMKAAEKYLRKNGIKIYGDSYQPAFLRRQSFFKNDQEMVTIRDFCFKQGEMLLPRWKTEHLKPLGYKNSQSMVCFEHTTPNNTLPILWYEQVIPNSDRKWNAIFPRFANSRIDRGRRLRSNANFWLSAMVHLHLPNMDWAKEHINDSLRLICVIALKYKRKSNLHIANMLGITSEDVETVVREGVSKGLLEEDGKLTIVGREIYEEIRKKDKILEKENVKTMQRVASNTVYIPKSFRGLS